MIRRVILGGFLMSAAMLAGCAQLTNQGHAFEGQSFDANSRDALVIVGVTVARNRTSLGLTYPVYWATWSVNSGPSGHSDPKRSFQVNFAPASIPEDRMNDAVAPMQYRVFDVHPGKYSLAGLRVEGAGGSSILVDQRYTTSFSPHAFSVAKGEAVYIGNFIYDNGKFEPVARDNAAASKMLARYAKPSVVLISR